MPGEPHTVKGVIEAVYRDLKDGNKSAKIDLVDTKSPYIRVKAPTEEDVLALICTAQRLTTGHLLGLSTATTAIFIEPPLAGGNFHISMGTTGAIEGIRPALEMLLGTPKVALKSYSDRYTYELSEKLSEAFEGASGLHTSLILKVHIGYYVLKKYREGRFTLEEFESMVRSSRAVGQLDTR